MRSPAASNTVISPFSRSSATIVFQPDEADESSFDDIVMTTNATPAPMAMTPTSMAIATRRPVIDPARGEGEPGETGDATSVIVGTVVSPNRSMTANPRGTPGRT